MARLIISSPDGHRGILELTKPVITIGRGKANDLVLADQGVSRFHAVVKQLDDGTVVMADRGSTNGVRVNEQRITEETAIHNGDIARLGPFEIRFESVDDVAFDIRQAQIPSTLNQMLEGGQASFALQSAVPSGGTTEELMARIKKLERDNHLLTVLYDAGKALHSKLSLEEISQQVLSLCFRMKGVERGFLTMLDERGEMASQTEMLYRQRRQSKRPVSTQQPQINLSRAIVARIHKERQPILINDFSADERFQASESVKISGVRSAMCAPLVGNERIIGILYVDNLEKSAAFAEEELNVFALLAAQAAAALDSAVAYRKLAQQAAQRSTLERFLAPEVVKMVEADPRRALLGGVNQKVSILFADLRNFTAISEDLPPERVLEMLNEYFSRVTEVIFDHGGTLDKFVGDGVMALFGAPISKGNDAVRAVRAAVDIQRLMAELNRDARARGWPKLKVGVGINTGIVTVGNIGGPRRMDYTAVGDAVNVAARLVSEAAGAEILVTDATARELDETFRLTSRKPVLFKGKSSPVPVRSVRWIMPQSKAKAANGN